MSSAWAPTIRRAVGRFLRRLRRHDAPNADRESSVGEASGTGGTPPPEVAVEPTNIGPAFDELVAEVRRRQKDLGVDPDYDLVRDHFDHVHFVLQTVGNRSITPRDPIAMFLKKGPDAKRSPDINFSTTAYLERYPEKATGEERSPYLEWLKRGKAAGEIADPAPEIERMARVLGVSAHDLVDQLVERRTDLQSRLRHGKLGEMFRRASEIDPLVGGAWGESGRPVLLPLDRATPVLQMSALHAAHEQAEYSRARIVLVVNRPRWGGGRRMEGHIAHALADRIPPDEIVVIYTEAGGSAPAGRYPDAVREVDLAAHTADMESEWREHTLTVLLRSFQADAIVNVNSGLFHRAMRSYGKGLAASERIFPVFFCSEQDVTGQWYGWPISQLYRQIDQVAGVITDSEYLARWFEDTYQLDPRLREKVTVLHAPVDPGIPVVAPRPSAEGHRPVVFWAGRWDRQKKIDVFLQIARLLPDVEFRMFGEPVLERAAVEQVPENVRIEGRYSSFTDLDLDEADLWLYTSAWDGVPSILLEVAMTGIPVVGSLVGGTEEVLRESEAWPVTDTDEAQEYVKAIREVLDDPANARRRALALRERMLRERSAADFAGKVADLLLAGDEGAR